jgi:hypothetical protein
MFWRNFIQTVLAVVVEAEVKVLQNASAGSLIYLKSVQKLVAKVGVIVKIQTQLTQTAKGTLF